MELYIPPQRFTHNKVNGQFLKGHRPHNKGKRWVDYMTDEAMERASRGWANLDTHRPKTRPDNAGRCRKQVVAVMDDGAWCVISHMGAAAEKVGGCRENIRRCCRLNKQRHINKKTGKVNTNHKYMGIRFYYESDNVWLTKIRKT